MKKTGKALSLVLSLALVASSLTATFASAATSSEKVTASMKAASNSGTLYLSNGGKQADNTDRVDLVQYLKPGTGIVEFSTSDGYDVTGDMKLKEIVITSGSSYATLNKADKDSDGNFNTQYLVLTSDSNKTGIVTVSARYQGTIERGENQDTDVTANSSATLTLKILKKGAACFSNASTATKGHYPDAVDSLPVFPKAKSTTAYVLTVAPEAGTSALATWAQPTVGVADGDYQVKVSTSDSSIVTATTSSSIATATATTSATKSAKAGTTVSLTATKYTVSSTGVSSNATAATATIKIAKKVLAPASYTTISYKNSTTWLYTSEVTDKVAASDKNESGKPIDVSGMDVQLSGSTTMVGGTIGQVLGAQEFELQKGTVASINDDVTKFTQSGGTVSGSVGDSDGDVATVNINGGKTGAIYGTTVEMKSDTTGKTITTGDIYDATSVTLSSTDASVIKTGDIKANTDAVITLTGNDVTVGQINSNYKNTTLNLKSFIGTIAAPTNAYTIGADSIGARGLTISAAKDDSNDLYTNATVTGDATVPTLTVEDSNTLNFTGSLTAGKVGNIDGSGVLGVQPGKLYSKGAISNVSLKLLSDFKVGDVAFTADSSADVDSNAFTPVGFTLTQTSGTTKDTFKIATISFAGLTVSGPDTITKGSSATYTVSAYPNGTSLPTGDTIAWYYTGNDDNFTFATTTDGKLTVTAKAYDSTFTSNNKATLTAKVLDSNGDVVDTYTVGTKDVAIVLTATYTSDTAAANLKVGQTYQFKITSSDGSVPPFAVASNGATVAPYTKSGNAYFFKVTAAKAGTYGVYCGNKVATLTITSDVTIDTAKVTIAAGKTYQFKVTASKAPVFQVAGVGTIKASSSNGNNYFYKVTATSAKGGHGVYVNGQCVAVATFA